MAKGAIALAAALSAILVLASSACRILLFCRRVVANVLDLDEA
jgi:hypothetical protein